MNMYEDAERNQINVNHLDRDVDAKYKRRREKILVETIACDFDSAFGFFMK